MSSMHALKNFRRMVLDKRNPVNMALAHFDHFYGQFFGKGWPSIRIALLTQKSYSAIVTNPHFNMDQFAKLGVLNLRDIFQNSKPVITTEVKSQCEPVAQTMEEEYEVTEEDCHMFYHPNDSLQVVPCSSPLTYPDHWEVFVHPRGQAGVFPRPQKTKDVLDYYIMDAASLLPPLALGIEPGHSVLDLCAAPGGKSLAALLTRRPAFLLCNEFKKARLDRLKKVFEDHDLNKLSIISLSNKDAAAPNEFFGSFDRVLVDVPCTNDRLSVTENRNSIFRKSRDKERQKLPFLQKDILVTGLRSLAPGGVLVYSTCSLSPVQNDGVVHMALQELSHSNPELRFEVQDLAPSLPAVFSFSPLTRLGQLVVPSLPLNYGPLYLARIHRPVEQ